MTQASAPGDGGVQFGRGGARRPAPVVTDPQIEWASARPVVGQKGGTYTGWFVEVGKCPPELVRAMQAAKFSQLTIKHMAGPATHFAIPVADVFVACDGVMSIPEMQGTKERTGIAFGWRVIADQVTGARRRQSVLRARVFLRPLLEAGYPEPLMLAVSGTKTSDVLTALTRQYDVLDAYQAERDAEDAKTGQARPPVSPPFYAFSIPLGSSEEPASRGKANAQTDIYVPVAEIPPKGKIGREYLKAHYIRQAWVPLVERIMDETLRWSVAYSAQIAQPPRREEAPEIEPVEYEAEE